MNITTETNSEVPSIPLFKLREIKDLSEAEGRRVFIELTEDEIYPSQHKEDMGETDLHYSFVSYLRNSLKLFFEERNDVFVAANMNLYYEEYNPQKWLAPDVMIAFGANDYSRRTYKLWQEKTFPQVIFEIASETTWREDIAENREIYDKLGVKEYYLIDTEDYLPLPLMAYRRENNKLQQLYLNEDRVSSPLLGLEIVHTGAEIKLFDLNKRNFLPNLAEATARAEAAQIEIEQLKAELARLKGER